MEYKTHCKVSINNDIRRFSLNSHSFNALESSVRDIFKIASEQILSIRYKDDENDLVTLESDLELETAIQLCQNQLLRLFVTLCPQVASPDSNVSPSETRPCRERKSKYCRKGFNNQSRHVEICHRIREGRNALSKELWGKRKEMKVQPNSPYSSVLIRDPISPLSIDVIFAEPEAQLSHVLKFKNDGVSEWPEGTMLMRVGRSPRVRLLEAADMILLPGVVKPGEISEILLKLKAPVEGGCYPSFWRLALPDGTVFGTRAVVKVKIGNGKSSPNCPKKFGKGGKWCIAVRTLVEMGFEKNPALMKLVGKHRCDISAVVEELTRQ